MKRAALAPATAALMLAGCADQSVSTKAVASHVPVVSYTDITLGSVPMGAAVQVDGQFVGYSPTIIRERLEDGALPSPVFITFVPTAPGQFTQHGSIGLWSDHFGPTSHITAFMYDTGIHAKAAAMDGY